MLGDAGEQFGGAWVDLAEDEQKQKMGIFAREDEAHWDGTHRQNTRRRVNARDHVLVNAREAPTSPAQNSGQPITARTNAQ